MSTGPGPAGDDVLRDVTIAVTVFTKAIPGMRQLSDEQRSQALDGLERLAELIDRACDALEAPPLLGRPAA